MLCSPGKNKHITQAYVLYEYAKSLPEKMLHLEVAPGQLKSIKEQVSSDVFSCKGLQWLDVLWPPKLFQ